MFISLDCFVGVVAVVAAMWIYLRESLISFKNTAAFRLLLEELSAMGFEPTTHFDFFYLPMDKLKGLLFESKSGGSLGGYLLVPAASSPALAAVGKLPAGLG